MRILLETPSLTIQQDAAHDCLFLTWRGQQSAKSIEAASEIILEQVRLTRSCCLLNDASQDLDGWSKSIAWFRHEIHPKFTDAGIRAIAWVLPQNLRALADTKNLLNLVEHAPDYRSDCPEINTFGDVESASRWLHKKAAFQ